MDLKTRKLINNLPKYSTGTFNTIHISRSAFEDAARDVASDVGDLPTDRESWSSGRGWNFGGNDDEDRRTAVRNEIMRENGSTLPPPTVNRNLVQPSGASGLNGIGPAFLMTYNAANNYKTQEELFNQQPRSTSYAFGQQYQRIQDIDQSKEMDAVNSSTPYEIFLQSDAGAKIGGGIMPGIGHGIGGGVGLVVGAIASRFKKNNAERSIDAALKWLSDVNTYDHDFAATLGVLQQLAKKYGVKDGKDAGDTMGGRLPKFFGGKGVNTAYGIMPGEPNALTNKGEEILDTETGVMSHVGRGPNDTAPSYLRGKDAVITTNDGLAKKARMYYNRGDMAGVASVLQEQQMNHMLGKYKNGKLPRFEDGGYISPWPSYIASGIGTGINLWLLIDAYKNKPYRPQSFADPYDYQAIKDMAKARYDIYPALSLFIKERARTDRALDMSGGLSGAQRYLGKVSNSANYYNALSDLYSKFQQANIGLINGLGQLKLNSSANSAKERNLFERNAEDVFARGHGMQLGRINDSFKNEYAIAQNSAADSFKRQQANYMLGLYDQQLANDRYDLYNKYRKLP